MPLILTPGQFHHRAEFYHQLAQLTSAGIGVVPEAQLVSHVVIAQAHEQLLEPVGR